MNGRAALQSTLVFCCCLLGVGVWWHFRIEASIGTAHMNAVTFDDYSYHYPMFEYGFRELRAGRLPLWNPYQLCGIPFLATAQHMLLYPFAALHLVLTTGAAMRATDVLHVLLAVVFTAWLARTFGLSRVAALTAGFAYAFSVVMAQYVYFPVCLYGAAWVPLHLALARRLVVASRKATPALALGGTLALQYLCAYPMISLFSAYLVAGYVVWHSCVGRDGAPEPVRPLADVVALTGAFVVAAGLSAPQLLPALELARLSPRVGLTIASTDIHFRADGSDLRDLALSTFLPARDALFGGAVPPHVGAVGLALAVVALFHRQRREVAFFIALALVTALLGLGRHTPLYSLYFHLPTANLFRLPERFFLLTTLALAVLAGFGTDVLWREPGSRVASRLLLVATTAGAGLLVVGFRPGVEAGAAAVRALLTAEPASLVIARVPLLRVYLVAMTAWLVAYILLPEGPRRWLAVTLPAILYASLFTTFCNRSALPDTHPDGHVMSQGVADFIRGHQGWGRTYITPTNPFSGVAQVPSKAGMMEGIYAVADRENLYPRRFADYVARMRPPGADEAMQRFATILGIGVPPEPAPQGEFPIGSDFPNLRLLDMLSTRYLVDGPASRFTGPEGNARFPLVYEEDGIRVFENPAALERTFVVGRAEVMPEGAVLDRLTSATFDPRASVVLEEDGADAEGGRGEARISSYSASEVVIDASASTPSLLVLTDQYYPGWTAEVDGRPASIYRANYLFRAVPVPAGSHRVVFSYRPRSFYLGVAILGVTMAALAVGALVSLPRRKAMRG